MCLCMCVLYTNILDLKIKNCDVDDILYWNACIVDVVDAVMAVLVHPCQAARLAAAWCLRCLCVAVPSQNTPVIDRY